MNAIQVGSAASKMLLKEQAAEVIGITSKGIFLRVGTYGVIYVTCETSHGPLNINIDDSHHLSARVPLDASARIKRHDIIFPQLRLEINTAFAPIWHAPARSGSPLHSEERCFKLKEVLALCKDYRKNDSLLALAYEDQPSSQSVCALHGAYHRMKHILHCPKQPYVFESNDSGEKSIFEEAAQFFGIGRGLTPCGDDLITGIMITLSRWGDILVPGLNINNLTRNLTLSAYQKTTLLAANLIECAGNGQADHHLLLALDGLVTGNASISAIASSLASWGSTSGFDALAGMALVLS
jgi:hypothetical protein